MPEQGTPAAAVRAREQNRYATPKPERRGCSRRVTASHPHMLWRQGSRLAWRCRGMKRRVHASIGGALAVALTAMTAGCGARRSGEDRATAERAAIHRDLKKDADALYRIAVTRTKVARPDVREKQITCAASNVDIQFVAAEKAIYTASYACGVAPWQPGQAPPLATPTIKV